MAKIPILHDGRVKPLDTFAGTHLLAFYGRRSLPDESAMEWLIQLLLDPGRAYERKIFDIRNPDLAVMLSLEPRSKHKYSFREVSGGLDRVEKTVMELHMRPEDKRTPVQNQLVDLYFKTLRYFEISRTFSLVLPTVILENASVARSFNLETGKAYHYLDLLPYQPLIEERLKKTAFKKPQDFTEEEWALSRLGFHMDRLSKDERSSVFRIFPPQWESNREIWLSPWQLTVKGQSTPETVKQLHLWRDLGEAYHDRREEAFHLAATSIEEGSRQLTKELVRPYRIALEVQYNRWDLFTKSLVFYILAFLLLATSWIFQPKRFRHLSFLSLMGGAFFHLVGVVLRIIIMQRPPVSTLYESIIFVALIAVVFGIILEKVRQNGIGILIATTIGTVLHFIGFGYANDGETLGMLVAVLNTNFWLATHVVTITTGYGCCLVAGVVGHFYLIQNVLKPQAKKKLKELYHNMVGISLFALFFAMFGTILGGIWADQSWGRFWGWDPKENGALLIVLWLLWLLHGLITRTIKQLGFALGMVVTNIMVALAWFGVNLLNVGLHSYGFTDSIALNLALFCSLELLFGVGFYSWGRWRLKEA